MPTLSGRVYEDANADGELSPGENGRAGVTIEIVSADGLSSTSTTTDSDGNWTVSLAVGDWVVTCVEPSGWAAVCATGTRSYFAALSIEDVTDADFALFALETGGITDRFCVEVWVYGIEPLTSTTDGFVLGHHERGRLGGMYFNRLRSGDLNTPTDITSFVETIDISRGRRRALDSFDAGSCTVVVEGTDQRFDQLHSDGAHSIALDAGGRKQLFRRGRAIRVVATGTSDSGFPVVRSLFSGWIDAIKTDYSPAPGSIHQRTTITCTDAFGLAGRVDRNEADLSYGGGETMGPRIRRWAEAAGLMLTSDVLPARPLYFGDPVFPALLTSGWRYGVVGDEGARPLQSTQLSENALTAMKAAAASDDALLYANADGLIVHQARTSLPDVPEWAPNAPRFSDSNSGLPLTIAVSDVQELTLRDREIPMERVPTFSTDTTDVATYVSLARAGGTARIAVDSSTVDVVGRVAFSRTDLINNNDADVDAIAAAILARHASEAKTIVSDVATKPWLSDAAMAAALLLELTSPVYFVHTLVLPYQTQLYVQGIRHEIRPNLDWTATYTLSEVQ